MVCQRIRENKIFDKFIGIEIIEHSKGAIIASKNINIYNHYIVIKIDYETYKKAKEIVKLLEDLGVALESYYKQGVRDLICLALSGYLRKKGYDIEFAKLIVECLCIAFNDEERDNRIKQCVEQTYKQDIERVSAYKIAKEVSEELAKELSKIFGIKERDEDILTVLKSLGYSKAYNLALGLLRYDLDNNKKEAEFIKDYIYMSWKSQQTEMRLKGIGIVGINVNGKR